MLGVVLRPVTEEKLSDAEGARLLADWRAGDREAGGEFVNAYFPVVLRFFRNKIPSDVELDGVVGQTFEQCQTTTAPYKGTGSLQGWILGVARFTLFRHFRAKVQQHKAMDPLPDELTSADVDDREPASVMVQVDDLRLALKALRRIPIDQQIVIEMRVVEGMGLKEIAEAVDAPQPTVSRRWQLGMAALRKKMQEMEKSPEKFGVSTHSFQTWVREVKAKVGDSMQDPNAPASDPDDEA